MSQRSPVKLALHTHSYLFSESWHVPPFWHGFGSHSLMLI